MAIEPFAGVRPHQNDDPHLEGHARVFEVSIKFFAGVPLFRGIVFAFVVMRLLFLLL